MVYFNRKPYTPSSSAEVEQWGRVLTFQQSFPKEGLWWQYNGARQFERLFRNHLTQFVRRWNPEPGAYLRSIESSSIPALVECESAPAYQLLPSLSIEIQRIVRRIVDSELKRGRSTRPGCRELFALYRALRKLLDASRRLIELLERSNIVDDLDPLVECHYDLSDSFRACNLAATDCLGQLSIFDRSASDAIAEIMGSKGERLDYWGAVFAAAAERIKDSKMLAKIDKIREERFAVFERIVLKGAISLDDSAALRQSVEDGRMRIARLEVVSSTLADVIKSRQSRAASGAPVRIVSALSRRR
jgi:hypothetical protein